MYRFRWITPALLAIGIGACSDDDGGGNAGSGNDQSSGGTGGTANDGGSGGRDDAAAGATGGDATYSIADACARFAEAACDKGVECGLVLDDTGSALICLQCNALSVQLIAAQCAADLSAPPNAADVDSCIASISTTACADACSGEPFVGCSAFDQLPSGAGDVTCDARCAEQ